MQEEGGMSAKANWNYFRRPKVVDRCVRAVIQARDEALLHQDVGDAPMTAAAAYDLGREGGAYEMRRVRRWLQAAPTNPALPTDCIRAYDAGLALDEKDREEDRRRDEWDDWSERQWEIEHGDPLRYPQATHASVEWEQMLQEESQRNAAWQRHEEGFEEPPLFMIRVGKEYGADFASW
jgi:hypothetical protein